MRDLDLECVDCGNLFIFTADEQDFYGRKNLDQPKRCKGCRQKKREQREQREQSQVRHRRD